MAFLHPTQYVKNLYNDYLSKSQLLQKYLRKIEEEVKTLEASTGLWANKLNLKYLLLTQGSDNKKPIVPLGTLSVEPTPPNSSPMTTDGYKELELTISQEFKTLLYMQQKITADLSSVHKMFQELKTLTDTIQEAWEHITPL